MEIVFDLGKIDWTAISAIGTILAAIATFWAVLVALNTNKPKVNIRSMLNMVHSPNGLINKWCHSSAYQLICNDIKE